MTPYSIASIPTTRWKVLIPAGWNIFSPLKTRPEPLWDKNILLFNGCRIPFPMIRWPEREVYQSPLNSAEVTNELSLNVRSSCISSWCIRGQKFNSKRILSLRFSYRASSIFVTMRITNRCDFLYYVFISFFSSFPYMFRAFMGPSSGVFQAVVLCYHLVHAVLY